MNAHTAPRVLVPERHKRPGLCYAVTDDGIELPVIDVTHPAFDFDPGEAELAEVTARTLQNFEKGTRWPAFAIRLIARRSLVTRNVLKAAGTYLDGVATYINKLGPENVGKGWGGSIDRRLLGTMGPLSTRLRLRDLARLMAEHLVASLPGTSRDVCCLNIAGGTAIDSLNALIVARRQCPGLFDGRGVTIHVLDPDAAGADFGGRALASLKAEDGPLRGVNATLSRIDYDWRAPEALRSIAAPARAGGAIVLCSSEGGLFEYGTDDEVASNLAVLRDVLPPDAVVAGTLLLDAIVGQAMAKHGRVALVLRERQSFAALARSAGWAVERAIDAAGVYLTVAMRKAT